MEHDKQKQQQQQLQQHKPDDQINILTTDIPPVPLWGLDPLHRSAIKLFIKQLHFITQVPNFEGVYLLYGHPVTRFEVVGCIISIHRKEQFIKFAVDDGTAVVACCVWLKSISYQEELFKYQLGQLVSVCGKLNIFREEREIKVDRISLELDPHFELFHWTDIIRLQEIYKKKLELPEEFLDN